MDISGAQQWWQEWQLRILVLGSLFIQSILCVLATQRKHAIPSWLRSITWLMYIGGDALAIYAFATLFSRQKQQTTDGRGRTLELLWAPILLIHLGGQASINAYSLEDSKLWKQHVLILVSKVTVALYIFIKWWSGSNIMLMAAVGLLILGILKFMEKPWALWIGSYDRFVSTIAESPQSKEHCGLSLQEYVGRSNQYIREAVVGVNSDQEAQNIYKYSLKMLADLPVSCSDRLNCLQSFLKLDDKHAYEKLQRCHGDTFRRLYTRNTSRTHVFWFNMLASFVGSFSATTFYFSKKDGYNVNDVRVTYILLCCCTMLEYFATISALILDSTSWHRMVSQYTLISFCALRKKPTILMKLATFNCIQKYLYEHWCARQVPVALQITELVRRQVRDGWNMYIHDVASYRVFNNCRGQWTLHRLVSESDHRQQLGQSLKMLFDESVLLWHIATDLCFHHANASPRGRQDEATQRSREISNYMFYLLSIHPEMLMPGTRPDLSSVASDDVDRILKDSNAPIGNEEMLAREIMSAATRETCTMMADACKLAETLMGLGDEKKRWQVIQGVWVEMLCYSAARCRGYLHAKSLGDGGEYLSYVWLLWAFMGMETLAEKIHKPEPPGEEEITAAGALASPSQGGVDQTVEIHISETPGEEDIIAAGALVSPLQGGIDQTVETVSSPV